MKRLNSERYRDRRSNRRYRVQVELQFRLGAAKIGRGRTLNLSQGGILFESDEALPMDTEITLWIPWPLRISNQAGLQLIVQGRTVRIQGNRTAVRFLGYSIETAGVPKVTRTAGNGKE